MLTSYDLKYYITSVDIQVSKECYQHELVSKLNI